MKKLGRARWVITDDLIDAYIGLKMQEVTRLRMTTHPVEYKCIAASEMRVRII